MIELMLFYVDFLFTCGECSLNSLVSSSYSKEWVWNLGTQTVHSFIHSFIHSSIHSFVNCQLGDMTLQEFNITYTL